MSAIASSFLLQGSSFTSALWLSGILLRLTILSMMILLIIFDTFSPPVLAACLVVDFPSLIWSFTRYNSAAMDYLRSTLRFWTVVGGYLFFFLSALASIFIWWFILKDFEHAMPAPRSNPKEVVIPTANEERYVINFTKEGTAIMFSGVVVPGAVVDFERFVLRSPQVKTVVLNSNGGDIYEAREFAADIRKYGLNTHVDMECNSSCLLLFMAGEERTLGSGAKIGTHRYGLDFEQLRGNLGLIPEMRTDQQYLLERGVTVDFLEQYFDLDRQSIWYPTRAALLDARVLTQ